ncbi:glutathione S-transferase [Thalassotalea fusca]
MKLIGKLDSPYVRRVAISLQYLGLTFEHHSLSVFQNYEEFKQHNPVVKAPTVICEDGTVLMDSSVILDYAENLVAPKQRLVPCNAEQRRKTLHIVGLALVANEKSVQVYYEQHLRSEDKQDKRWLSRVTEQAKETFVLLENAIKPLWHSVTEDNIDQAVISTAVAWYFAREVIPEVVDEECFPSLAQLSQKVESYSAFQAASFHNSCMV